MDKEELLHEITNSYLSSYDFNGTPLFSLLTTLRSDIADLVEQLKELIKNEEVCVLFGDTDLNTHIIRLGHEPIDIQLEKIGRPELNVFHTCVYPTRKQLEKVVDQRQYTHTPYILELALGNPQLSFRAFDLSILEFTEMILATIIQTMMLEERLV